MTRYRIRELLDERGMSARDRAQRSGVSATTLTNLLQGRGEPLPVTLERLATALGVKTEELIDRTPTS